MNDNSLEEIFAVSASDLDVYDQDTTRSGPFFFSKEANKFCKKRVVPGLY
jgi:hypothetical protein